MAQPFTIRAHRIGDIGHVIGRHGALYHAEYGWNGGFEALVAEIGAAFIRDFDPARECCRIGEIGGRVMGSAFVMRKSNAVAQLRLVYVEPEARGFGLGRALVRDCLTFARGAGYSGMTLWTNDILHAARRIYEREGFCLTAEERHRSFGQDLVGQTFDLTF